MRPLRGTLLPVRGRSAAITLAGVAFALLLGPAAAEAISRAKLHRELSQQMRRVGGASGSFVTDFDAPDHRTLFTWASHTRRILASNTKLFTMAAAFDRFGASGRRTSTVYPRRPGAVQGSVVHGNLVLVGDGDPALGSSHFAGHNNLPLTSLRPLVKDVRTAGIRRIKGKIKADDSIFDRRRGVPSAGVDARGELAPLSGLSYNYGFADGGYASNPELVAARSFRKRLIHAGIRVTGGIGRADLPKARLAQDPLGAVQSRRFKVQLAATLKPSNNFLAEMTLKRLAASRSKSGTTRRGSRRVERFAKKLGTGVSMENGSGLSRRDRASPRQVGRLLVKMERRADGSTWVHSLPAAGKEGTVAHRMNGTAADGRCWTKTGTLIGVSALSGYCRAGHGLVAFSLLMNSVDINLAHKAQDRIASLIARYRP